MASIADQLTQLESDRQDLVSNLETKGISGLTGDETFTELVPEVLNISTGGGVNINDYFDNTIGAGDNKSSYINKIIKKIPDNLVLTGASFSYAFFRMSALTEIPSLNYSLVNNFSYFCDGCSSLEKVNQINTSGASNFYNMFNNCILLEEVPQFDLSNANNLSGMFGNCRSLTNQSLNNILYSLANANSSYTNTKTLYAIFNADMSQYYPASTIQSLSNYQAFTNAGWTIGWN